MAGAFVGLVVLRAGRPVAAGPMEAFMIEGHFSSEAVEVWLLQCATAPLAPAPAASLSSRTSDADSEVC